MVFICTKPTFSLAETQIYLKPNYNKVYVIIEIRFDY